MYTIQTRINKNGKTIYDIYEGVKKLMSNVAKGLAMSVINKQQQQQQTKTYESANSVSRIETNLDPSTETGEIPCEDGSIELVLGTFGGSSRVELSEERIEHAGTTNLRDTVKRAVELADKGCEKLRISAQKHKREAKQHKREAKQHKREAEQHRREAEQHRRNAEILDQISREFDADTRRYCERLGVPYPDQISQQFDYETSDLADYTTTVDICAQPDNKYLPSA
jgi:hypothetical protein